MAEETGRFRECPEPLRLPQPGRLTDEQIGSLRGQLKFALGEANAIWATEGLREVNDARDAVITAENRLAEIERHLSGATPGRHRRDCGGRIFADIGGEDLQIGEAFSEGDARLWRHAAEDIRWLLDEVKRRGSLLDT